MSKCSCGVVPGDCYDACGARESQISDLINERDEARAEVQALRVERNKWEAKAKEADGGWKMYANAWQRELGPWMRRKSHHIDACVVSTRDLRAAAEDHTKPHCCGQPEYCTDHGCAKLLRHRMGLDAAIDQARGGE